MIDEARANADARRAHAARYLLNTLTNASTTAREGDIRSLFDAFEGVPAVIVGAGPSLDGRLHEVAAMSDRATAGALKPTAGSAKNIATITRR